MGKVIFNFIFVLLIIFLLGSEAFCSAGSWSRQVVGPNMYLEGRIYALEFEPLGSIPANAIITSISWNWSFQNQDNNLIVFLGNPSLGYVNISDMGNGMDNSFFDGGNPSSSIFMNFRVPGSGTVIPAMYGKMNTVNVSWQTATPESTPIIGPTELEVAQTLELDGTVEYATLYTWTITGNCSIMSEPNGSTVSIKGDRGGECTATREGCNAFNECITNTHSITVTSQVLLIPTFHLLLLKKI